MAHEDGGEMFVSTVKSIGSDLWRLFETIVREQRRQNQEKQAQMAAAMKEKKAEEMAERLRKEEREFMKSENEKLRSELRDVLKANGLDTSEKNMGLAREQVEKMAENQEQIDANNRQIGDIDKSLQDIDRQQQDCLNPKPGPDGITPEPDMEKWRTLQDQANDLVQKKAKLQEDNEKLEAENVMLKNGRGLEGMEIDESVKNDLAKQMSQLEAGINVEKRNLDYINKRLPKIEEEQAALLKSPKPDMDKWEKLQTEKENLRKEKVQSQEKITKQESQLKDLQQGKSLEQMEKVSKLQSEINLAKQEVQSMDGAIKGYQQAEDALRKTDNPDPAKLKELQEKREALEAKRETAKKEVAKLEKELDTVKKGPQLEGVGKVGVDPGKIEPLSQGPEVISPELAPKLGVDPSKVEPLSQGPEVIPPELSPRVGVSSSPEMLQSEPVTIHIDESSLSQSSPQISSVSESPRVSVGSKDGLGVGKDGTGKGLGGKEDPSKLVSVSVSESGGGSDPTRRQRSQSMAVSKGEKETVRQSLDREKYPYWSRERSQSQSIGSKVSVK